ncbi:hypothetical protein [Haloarcula salinisoli]|uniref:Uncharacterized protein n=1 Tax=Haloarcula salinisoli TaxID=2487746 RepID=A0A8J7YF43_9EURY|nr:hypothetical protein [Halomicroarcula salinisoli]MBX0287508.1 hypothetical protein [Halomicroarcula salinisoli]MBX0304920.1 hypothetical protein [Halomicroarcula salinisoli]
MPDITPETVEAGDDYYHVRYRDPEQFDEIRTPDWAENPAGSVVEGAQVRTGDEHGNENWTVQSVLVPVDRVADRDEAAQQADQIVEKLSS